MTEKKVDFTRRRILGGLAAVGTASAVTGAGTFALFDDTETSNGNEIQAGSLDLTLDGSNEPVTLIDVSDAKPSQQGSGETTLRNAGSVDGYVDFAIDSITSSEHGRNEVELPVDPTGNSRGTFSLDFTDSDDAASATSSSAGWVTDRYEPAVWQTATFDGRSRLHIQVDETGPSADEDTSKEYQGKKYVPDTTRSQWNAGNGARLKYRFYVDPSWESDSESHDTGVWIVGGEDGESGDVNDTRTDYSILHYQDSSASASGSARFRYFDGAGPNTGWHDVGLPSGFDPQSEGWVDVEYVFDASDGEHRWYVNGELFYTDSSVGTGTDVIYRPIVQAVNFGATQDYYYDDLRLVNPGNGELFEHLEVQAYFDTGSTKTYVIGDDSTSIPLSDAISSGDSYETDYLLNSQSEADFVVDWQIPTQVGNEIQGDGVSVDFTFQLAQEPSQ